MDTMVVSSSVMLRPSFSDVATFVYKYSPIIQASALALEAWNDGIFWRYNCPHGPRLLDWTMSHIVCSEGCEIVGILHLQSGLDLGGAVSLIGSDLLKVFST